MQSNSEKNKRIIKNTAFLYAQMLFMMAISLYTSRVVLNTLGVEDFGIYNVVGGIVVMFTFLNKSMSAATHRYITFELGKGDFFRLQKVFSTSISIHALISVVIFILGETVGLWFLMNQMVIPTDRMDAAMWVYQSSILSMIIMMMSIPYNAAIIAHEKMSFFAYISILEVILKLLIVYLLVLLPFDKLKFYAILTCFVLLIIRISYGIYCRKYFKETKYKWVKDRVLFKEMIGFAGWSMNGGLAWICFTQGLNILLNIFFGSIVNAARGIAVQVQTAVMSFCYNFQMAMNPQITKSFAANDFKYMQQLVFASSKYSFFLLFILSLPVLLETNLILKTWLGIIPDYTSNFVRIMLIINLIEALSIPMVTSIQATGKIKRFQIWEGSILLLILPVSYLTLKLGAPPESVFIVHLSIAVLAQCVRIRIVCPMVHIKISDYFKGVIVKIIVAIIPMSFIPLALSLYLPENIVNFLIICVSCVIFTIGGSYFFGLEANERLMFKTKFKKIIYHKKKE